MDPSDREQLSNWFESLITFIRENDLSDNYQYAHYGDPCQVEVFCIKEPLEAQLAIITNDEDRTDSEIIINGPFESYEFIDEVNDIIESERWQKPIQPSEILTQVEEPLSKAKILPEAIRDFKNQVEKSLFRGTDQPLLIGNKTLWGQGHYFTNIGSIVEHDMTDVINRYSVSDDIQDRLFPEEDLSVPPENEVFGGYIREPVWIENRPETSFRDMIFQNASYLYGPLSEYDLLDMKCYVRCDGLVILKHNNKKKVQEILNILLGIGLFQDYRNWRSILDRHIINGGMTEGRLTSWSIPEDVPEVQTKAVSKKDRHEREVLSKDQLEYFINIAEFIYPIDQLRELIKLHLQAHTHLLEEEFRASFVLNWTVVEQVIEQLLVRNIDSDYDLDWDAKELEYASISDAIQHSEYKILDNSRNKRNSIIHEMETVSVIEAEKLDIMVSKLVVNEINNYIEDTDIPVIEFEPYPVMHANQSKKVIQEFKQAGLF